MTMPKKKYFGTDGIRGRFGGEHINPEFLLKLGWAAGMVLGKGEHDRIIIGKDTRISGYIIESVLEAGLAAAGVNVRLLGPMPTPAIAYLAQAIRVDAGIVISASHNPYYDNGIKFFSAAGTKISDELELAIEAKLSEPMQMVDSSKLGNVKRYIDAPGRYIEFCKSTFGGFNASLRGMKIILDCSNGATYHIAPRVFDELGAKAVELNVDPDGFNINENCGSNYTKPLRRMVLAEGADLGIAFDGDGDRVIMIDHKGEMLDGDDLLYIIAKYYLDIGTLKGGVVGTVMSNLGFEEALHKVGIDFIRAQVGDRYVSEALQQSGWSLGGEASGHIVNYGFTSTGDGIVTALQVLSAMQHFDKSLHALKQGMTKYPQLIVNVKISNNKDVAEDSRVKKAVAVAEKKLKDHGRVLLRASGTEPLIRVMVEGKNHEQVKQIAQELADVVEKAAD